jgi:hypothetical protein
MKRGRKSILSIVLVLVLSMAVATSALAGAIVEGENNREMIEFFTWVPCAADGAGEYVIISGILHDMYHFTMDDTGGYHLVLHSQPMGVKGVGETTGDIYQGTGVYQDVYNGVVGETGTLIDVYQMIGQGPGNNFKVHETLHVTVNANGELITDIANFTVECK